MTFTVLPQQTKIAFGLYLVFELLFTPLVFGKFSGSVSIVMVPLLIWSVSRGSRTVGYCLSAWMGINALLDLFLLLVAFSRGTVSLPGEVLLLAHLLVSAWLCWNVPLSNQMRSFFDQRKSGGGKFAP
jgi:hypothetical protein